MIKDKIFWWGEVGENFRAKLFDKDDGAAGTYLWKAYIKQMFTSLEITIPIKEVQRGSKLVEEAKKLGAEEIKKGGK